MLFSEVYGAYYNVLAQILNKAIDGELTQDAIYNVVREKGFEESILTIPKALESQTWPLITKGYATPLDHHPSMPLTILQKRWLKALLSDPRVHLFDPPMDGLEDVEPLYPPNTFVYYDRYSDGDPYTDPGYIKRFRCILSAIKHKRWLHIQFTGHNGGLIIGGVSRISWSIQRKTISFGSFLQTSITRCVSTLPELRSVLC